MKKFIATIIFIISFISNGIAQDITYFPERNVIWQEKTPNELNVNTASLADAVAFANANEYSESKDLRIAILKGFTREPFHEILGPTKERGGPAGIILKDGYIIAKWGDTKRVDMTFSVTKSFLSTVA